MKKKLKAIFLAMILSVSAIMSQTMTNVEAAGYTISVSTPYGTNLDPSSKWAIGTNAIVYGYDVYANYYVNGIKCYCIQQNVETIDGASDYSPQALGTYTGNAQLAKRLEYISALGYGFNGDYSQEMDFATQIRIWQEMGLGTVTNIHPDIQAKIDQINQRLALMDNEVSFNRSQIVLQGYGQEFAQTITDTNGCFSAYLDYSTSGIHTSRNGNTLTIWAEKGDQTNIDLMYDCLYLRNQAGTSIAYASPTSQNVGYLQGADPKAAVINVIVQTGSIQLTKQDADTGYAQGDATLEGATFDVVDNQTNQSVGTLTSDANGNTNVIDDLPTAHTYTIHETNAPEGYLLSDETKIVDFSTIGNANDEHKEYVSSFNNDVITGNVEIRKVITDAKKSEILTPEKDAEFIVVAKKYVDKYGDIELAFQHIDEMTDKEYDTLITDDSGYAKSNDLAYGTYVVKQTKRQAETEILKDTFTFTISEDGQLLSYNINNKPNEYYVRLVKKDKESQQTITLNSASFQIKDENGDFVTMKVSGKKYDTFTTTSDGGIGVLSSLFGSEYYQNDGEKGEVVTPLKLQAGTYTIEEIKVPDGFLQCDPITFTIMEEYVSESDDEDMYIEVEIEDEQPTGTLTVSKSIEDYTCDTSLVDKSDLSGFQFTLLAKEDVLSPIDGSTLYKTNEKVGTYTTDTDGQILVENIPMGSYYLKETSIKDGFVELNQEWDIEFKQEDTIQKVYANSLEIENQTTKVEVSKTSVTDQKELEGAKLEVTDEKGNVMDSWISSKETHLIEGLLVGHTYTLTETLAPEKYAKANSIEFMIENTGEVQHVDMVDKQVFVSKVDQFDQYVENAVIQLLDENGEVLDEWTTDENEYVLSNVEVGKEYTIHELSCPDNYKIADDITFVVEDDGKNQVIEMVDTKLDSVAITKYDATNQKELAGAKLKVVDEKGEVIDEWTSTKEAHIIDNLIVGKEYTLTEISAPSDYVVAESITFTIDDNGDVMQKVNMYDNRKLVVTTSIITHAGLFASSGLLSLLGIIYLLKHNKKGC